MSMEVMTKAEQTKVKIYKIRSIYTYIFQTSLAHMLYVQYYK